MKPYCELTRQELLGLRNSLQAEYSGYRSRALSLNMARGKPSQAQLELSMGILDVLSSESSLTGADGTDCRNYGVLDGIAECKELMAGMMGVRPEEVIIYGNSSLNVMYDTVARSMISGVMGSTPWCRLDRVKFLCPVPGYDRHFAITEHFGIEMISIPMLPTGPDMDTVERLVSGDPAVKGIWCVPMYANPTGISYSDETVRRFARLKPAAADFRIYWDNAYCIHHLYDSPRDQLVEILEACRQAGNPDMVYQFASTSKITFPGSGISALAASQSNLADIRAQMKVQTIGHDKINQLRHVRFFGNIQGMREHMRKHADILRPKFEIVHDTLERELGGLGIGSWTNPRGGYFVSFDSLDGCAREIVTRCRDAGLVLTGAGATHPYGKDPHDSNIRIAPSFPANADLQLAMEVFTCVVKLVSVKKFLAQLDAAEAK